MLPSREVERRTNGGFYLCAWVCCRVLQVMCLTKIYHPNIDLEGHVCLNILRDDWKPVLDINAVIYGIVYLFYESNPNDPLNHGECVRTRSCFQLSTMMVMKWVLLLRPMLSLRNIL